MTQPMSLTDDKVVEIMARARCRGLDHAPYNLRQLILSECRREIDALRAAGAEVVFWRPISDGYQNTADDEQWVRWPKNDVTTYFAILRGPEVKP